MSEQIALLTGATGGIGRVSVTELARAGARVVAVARDQERGERLCADIIAAHGSGEVEVLVGDLERQADVRAVAAQFRARHDRLDVLVNNAGAHFRRQELGSDGIERHVAVNHLAGFLLTDLLLPTIRATASATSSARIVNVVSEVLNDTRTVKIGFRSRSATIDPDRLGEVDQASPMHAYARSKLATLMCGYRLARDLDGTGIAITAVHPGHVATGIIDAFSTRWTAPLMPLIRRTLLTPEQGAEPVVRLATDPALAWHHRHLRPAPRPAPQHADLLRPCDAGTGVGSQPPTRRIAQSRTQTRPAHARLRSSSAHDCL